MSSAASPAPPLSIRGTFAALRVPTAHELLFSAKAAVAVAITLVVGFSQDLENPYWSALTVYVLLSQPEAGAIRSKALFRLVGTVLGGAGAILLAALFASHVGVLLIAAIVAIVLTYYAKTLDRTPVSYTWFATALTLAVVVITQVQAPASIFAFATTRMMEISLGILAIGVVDSIVFPRAATPAFLTSMSDWRERASRWAADALAPDASQEPAARRQRRNGLHAIAGLLGPLDALSVQLPYDIVPQPPSGRDLRFVRLTIAHLVAHLAAANLWIEAVRPRFGGAPDMGQLPAEVRAWMLENPGLDDPALLDHAARGDALRDRLAVYEPAAAAQGDHDTMLRATTLMRLAELVDQWSRLERALHAIAAGTRLAPALRREASRARPVRSIDYVLGLLDVAPMALALGFAATFWYVTTWTASIPAMLFIFISLGFILGTPGAVRAAQGINLWIAITCAITLVYQFAVLPRVTAFPTLIAALSVGMLPLGVLMTMSPAGLLILANAFAFLGLQSAYAANFGATLENLFGSIAGCLIGNAALYLCQFDRPRFRARRLVRAHRRDLVDAARGTRLARRDRLLSLSVDRMALYFGIVDALPEDDPLHREDLIDTFRIGANLLRLREQEPSLSPTAREPIFALRTALASAFEGEAAPDRAALLARAESAYEAVVGEPASSARAEALAALVGLCVSLSTPPLSGLASEGGAA